MHIFTYPDVYACKQTHQEPKTILLILLLLKQGFADVTNALHTHKIEHTHTQFLSQCECVGGTFPLLDCLFTLSREKMRAYTQIVSRRATSHDSEKNVPYYFLCLRFPTFNFIFPPLVYVVSSIFYNRSSSDDQRFTQAFCIRNSSVRGCPTPWQI